MRRIAPAILILLVLAAGATRAATPGLADAEIGDLTIRVQANEALVSFRLDNAFPDELLERLHSGISVTFRHKVDMILRRPFFLTPNKLLDRTVVETEVEYDSLTRQYRLKRRTENKTKRKNDPLLDFQVRRSTESLDEAVDWLTHYRDVPLILKEGFVGDERVRVRVSSNLGRHFVLWIFPSSYSVSAEIGVEW